MGTVPSTPFPWADYYAAMRSKPLHPHYANLDPHLPEGGLALELGCGIGHGAIHLASKGFRVVAVDAEAEALETMAEWMPEGASIEPVHSRFENLDLPSETYDVVAAHFTLFFLDRETFESFWPRLLRSIKPGGLLSVQLLGDRDEWVARGYTVQNREGALELLSTLEVLHFEEAEQDGETAQGTPKHWHVFHVVARKPT